MYAEGQLLDRQQPAFENISIVIPAHNESKYLGATIKSLQNATQAIGVTAEIIVVNDASTDDTREIAARLGARIVDVELRNIGAVRNAGAKEAQYPWLFFVDADTIVPEKTLRKALTLLADGCVGGGAHVDLDGQQPLFWTKHLMYHCMVFVWQVIGGWAAGCFMFCQKAAFESFGGFDEQYLAAEELFFSRSLKRMGKFRISRSPVITSARKLYGYSTWQLVKFIVVPLFQFGSLLKTRTGLDVLYNDNR